MTNPNMVLYRGVHMAEGFPDLIASAQQTVEITVRGKSFPRVRYGDEDLDWGAETGACRDCGVIKGEFHVPGCDVERCPCCGGQLGCCPLDE